MQKLISAKLAGVIILIILSLMVVLHILILSKLIPSDIVWAGQVGESSSNLLILELTALLVTLLFGVIILMKLGLIFQGKSRKAVDLGVWIIFAYFVLNTIGNLSTGLSLESMIFSPVTIILSILVLRLALEK